MTDQQEVAYALSIGTKIIDLGWPWTVDTIWFAVICGDLQYSGSDLQWFAVDLRWFAVICSIQADRKLHN